MTALGRLGAGEPHAVFRNALVSALLGLAPMKVRRLGLLRTATRAGIGFHLFEQAMAGAVSVDCHGWRGPSCLRHALAALPLLRPAVQCTALCRAPSCAQPSTIPPHPLKDVVHTLYPRMWISI